ncbi:carbohydrate ABC transporter permease [Vallitalea guaymasensis]|uniref:Carbohydrate ABC transporter permease n=1 Tax=Vallitalea guaymasensis TaxID=1185412 RepID=A0A8J8MBB5_9FIRM|nr:carbohydrate ABC transporter permease [Vallitalea guaymasensis]QUH29565.1 carbohydrate ABC transporter permease [Vallitalea guaymasensis]
MRKMKISKDDIIFDTINYILLSCILIIVLYPLYFIVIASISDPTAVSNGQLKFLPIDITFEGYKRIFQDRLILSGYKNTIKYTVIGTTINIFLTMMTAYPLSRKDFSGRKALMIFLMITMYFNGGLIPTYLIVKHLGLINNWLIMVLKGAVSVYNIIIARSFLQSSIPEELYEAAVIDGCSHIKFFTRVVLPLSKAIIAVLVLFYGIVHWNEFFTALIYLRDEKLYPLQLILRSILLENQMQDAMMNNIDDINNQQYIADLIKYGMIIVASLPLLVLYPFLQKYFVKGVMIGSVKG